MKTNRLLSGIFSKELVTGNFIVSQHLCDSIHPNMVDDSKQNEAPNINSFMHKHFTVESASIEMRSHCLHTMGRLISNVVISSTSDSNQNHSESDNGSEFEL